MLDKLAREIRDINEGNGWDITQPEDWEGPDVNKIPCKLALIHSEVSEALEAYRKRDPANFLEELADTLIRVLDCAGGFTEDFDKIVRDKMEVNSRRGYRHGGKKV